MPKQESYLELKTGDSSVHVWKTYDGLFAREAFDAMDDAGLRVLAQSLDLEETFDREDIPAVDAPDYRDFLWEAVAESSTEDGHLRSYFVVEVQAKNKGQQLAYVSGDWPSAQDFAKTASRAL